MHLINNKIESHKLHADNKVCTLVLFIKGDLLKIQGKLHPEANSISVCSHIYASNDSSANLLVGDVFCVIPVRIKQLSATFLSDIMEGHCYC